MGIIHVLNFPGFSNTIDFFHGVEVDIANITITMMHKHNRYKVKH